MNIRQLLLIVAGVLIGTSGALADDLTPEVAKQKAATFLLQKKSAEGAMQKLPQLPTCR